MNISENIWWITNGSVQWKLYKNRSYRAQIQRADPQRIYNVPGMPGVVYNFLDDAYEKVAASGYVVTGVKGEMWPINKETVKKYRVDPDEITAEPTPVDTVELDTVYAGVMIPADTQFTLEVVYGERAVLHGNSPGAEHGCGDYILFPAKQFGGEYLPDFNNSGRIVNGSVFDILYQPFCDAAASADS